MNAIELPKLNRAENRENVQQKLTIQFPGITNTRRTCENQFVRLKRAPGILQLTAVFKQQQPKIITNVLSSSRHTKQQHLDKRFKRNTSLFYNTENACLLVRETISLCSGCVVQTLALHELSWRLLFPDRFTFLEP